MYSSGPEDYTICEAPQQSEEWFRRRQELVVTSSEVAKACDRSSYVSALEFALEKAGITQKDPVTDYGRYHMARGNISEPIIRTWYSQKIGFEIVEVGLVIPKWCSWIGGSPDGLIKVALPSDHKSLDPSSEHREVTVEGLEIKAPEFLSAKLRRRSLAKKYDPNDYSHIPVEHYDQMQCCMAILGIKRYHYVVYSQLDKLVFTQIVPFNPEYWESTMEKLCKFKSVVEFLRRERQQYLSSKQMILRAIESKRKSYKNVED